MTTTRPTYWTVPAGLTRGRLLRAVTDHASTCPELRGDLLVQCETLVVHLRCEHRAGRLGLGLDDAAVDALELEVATVRQRKERHEAAVRLGQDRCAWSGRERSPTVTHVEPCPPHLAVDFD